MLTGILLKQNVGKRAIGFSRLRTYRLFSRVGSQLQKPVLEKIFDDGKYWRNLNEHNYTGQESYKYKLLSKISHESNNKIKTGLFNNPYLTNPMGLKKFSSLSLEKANALVKNMRDDDSIQGMRNYIVHLDQLSDTLCRVIDLCEFIRSTHPDSTFVSAAQECHEEMFEFMNILNTDVTLCNKLKYVLTTPDIFSKLTKEEIKVGNILLEDFQKSGIYMDPAIRDQFITLSQEISLVGQDFINNTNCLRNSTIKIKAEELESCGLSPLLLNQVQKDLGGQYYRIPLQGSIAFLILRRCNNENIRKRIWSELHNCPDIQIEKLTHLIKLRAILSNLMGKRSFAEYQLEGKMAKNPKNASGFVKTLLDFTKPLAAKELKFISDLKCDENGKPHVHKIEDVLEVVRPWDRDYYSDIVHEKDYKKKGDRIVSYFTLGSVLQGLSDLFKSTYGIVLQPEVPILGETWTPDVRKINVVSETDGIIGVVYCDLFEREGKTPNPAHFTVCCSREMYPDENDLSIMNIGVNSKGSKFQLPIISLVCNFSKLNEIPGDDICLLELTEIETLFHEMGHAMHSMLGRTKLQNISGTRCATDFVELPSILMEHFARDRRVLMRIGKHYKTGEPIQEKLLDDHLQKSKFLQHCETYAQGKMAMLDQELHGEDIINNINDLDVVKIYQHLEDNLKVLVDDKTNWCGRFGHLFGYGATYYSYLFDRAIAAKVWKTLFEPDPYNRECGEKFKNSVLKWGGMKDPWECIADVLDEPVLAKGDATAMKIIASAEDL